MMTDILDRLEDLHKQATTERSHHYTAAVIVSAIGEIKRLRNVRDAAIDVNCLVDDQRKQDSGAYLAFHALDTAITAARS